MQISKSVNFTIAVFYTSRGSNHLTIGHLPELAAFHGADVNSTRKPVVILPNLVSTLPKEEFVDMDVTVDSMTGHREVGHEARQSDKKLEETFADAASSGGSKSSEVSMGMIWLYFTIASLLCGVLALVGVVSRAILFVVD